LSRRPNASTKEILAITVNLIARHDISGMTIDMVAEKSGVSKATLYRRWASRDALVFDAITYMHRPEADPDTGSLRKDLSILLKELVVFLNRPAGGKVFAAFLNAAIRDQHLTALQQRISRQTRSTYEKVIERAIKRGELKANINTRLMLDIVIAPFLYRRIVHNGVAHHGDIRLIIDVALAAFGRLPRRR
jgi:AcrR family transcriptional regulator